MHFLRRALFLIVLFASAVLAWAGVSYDESAVFAFNTRDDFSGLAAESAVFAFDTRLIDGLSAAATSGTFSFNTRSLNFSGSVRTLAGVPVSGATITLQRSGTVFWQGTSGVNGAFSPSVAPSNYTAVVAKAGFRTLIQNVAGSAGGAGTLDFFLAELPVASQPIDTNRVPPLGTTASGSVLKVYVGESFVTNGTLFPDRMTIVLCHGWTGNPADWALDMAQLITARLAPAQPPNIVVWDWHDAAAGNFLSIAGKIDTAAKEGRSLGEALQQALGAGYSQHVHFIGHSLGTIVNRYACDYLHASFPPVERGSMNCPAPWIKTQTTPHVTLLDEAEIANVGGTELVTSTLVSSIFAGVPEGVATAAKNWKSPIPKDALWVDNYISLVGIQHEAAVNVCLLHAAQTNLNPRAAHAYSHQWYRQSVLPPAGVPDPAVGFARAFEKALTFPPMGNGMSLGSLWIENTATANPLDLALDTTPDFGECSRRLAAAYAIQIDRRVREKVDVIAGQVVQGGEAVANALVEDTNTYIVQPLDATGRAVMSGYLAGIETAGDIGGTVIYKTGQVITATKEKVGNLIDATQDHLTNAVDSIQADTLQVGSVTIPLLRIRLLTQAAPAPLVARRNPAANALGQPAYAWMTLHVPANAGFLAFDFTVTGQPNEDRIVCAINDANVFNLPAKFAPDGVPSSSDLIDVSAFAGQDIELFFGLAGGTSTNCEAAIDGIRFITIPQPKLALTTTPGGAIAIKWPAAASGWVLESTDSLVLPNWQTVPTNNGVFVDSGVATLEQPSAGAQKFYRLRRNP